MKCKNKIDEKVPLSVLISIIRKQYLVFLNNSLIDEGISAGQVPFLTYLYYNKKACQDEMGEHYKIDKGSVSRSIRKLEELELIYKELDENNRRKYILSLTEAGEKISQKIIKLNLKWEEKIYEKLNLPKERIDEVIRLMAITTIDINNEITEKVDENE